VCADGISYEFRTPALLETALTHSSYCAEHGLGRQASNERLEYLGDAILKAVAAEALMRLMPDADEGRMSKVSAQVLSGGTLARAAKRLGLAERLRLSRGEHLSGGRSKVRNLAGAMEAVIGAIYLDGGFDDARQFIMRSLDCEIRRAIEEPAADYKTALQERVQSDGRGRVSYTTLSKEGPAHAPRFTVQALVSGRPVSQGVGPSRRQAEQDAARAALEALVRE
jgi:ribonuclease-3